MPPRWRTNRIRIVPPCEWMRDRAESLRIGCIMCAGVAIQSQKPSDSYLVVADDAGEQTKNWPQRLSSHGPHVPGKLLGTQRSGITILCSRFF